MAYQQENHWWFKARREHIRTILKKYTPNRNIKILEIGCGTGANLSMLKEYGEVYAMEMNEFASGYASETTGLEIKIGWLPDNIPFDEKFNIVCLFDVIEHVKDDKTALKELQKLLLPDGIAIITVPAHPLLYGVHDKMHHHYRRYSTKALRKIIDESHMKTLKISHFNFLLFPALLITRIIDIILKPERSTGYSIPNPFLNKILYKIFLSEKFSLNLISVPFGGSAFVILKKH